MLSFSLDKVSKNCDIPLRIVKIAYAVNRFRECVALHAFGIRKPYLLAHLLRHKAVRLAVNEQYRLIGVFDGVRGGDVAAEYQVTVDQSGNADSEQQEVPTGSSAACASAL